MIKLVKGKTNKVEVTLTEKVKLSDPIFLFEFISNDTNESFLLISDDYSGNIERSNLFYINDPDDLDLIPGSYDYQVYETEHNVLNVGSASNIVEIGLMVVVGTMSGYDDYENIDNDVVYDG